MPEIDTVYQRLVYLVLIVLLTFEKKVRKIADL